MNIKESIFPVGLILNLGGNHHLSIVNRRKPIFSPVNCGSNPFPCTFFNLTKV